MNGMRIGVVAAAALTLGMSAPASAQTTGSDGWWRPVVQSGERPTIRDVVLGRSGENERRDGRGRTSRDGWTGDRYETRGGAKAKKGNGPPFCRNGQGHPVHGREWCARKGWSGGSWRDAGWTDVIFRGPGSRRESRIGQRTVADILGDVVFGRLSRLGTDAGLRGQVDGRWTRLADGAPVLQLRMGGVPLAELADLDANGRADVILLSGMR